MDSEWYAYGYIEKDYELPLLPFLKKGRFTDDEIDKMQRYIYNVESLDNISKYIQVSIQEISLVNTLHVSDKYSLLSLIEPYDDGSMKFLRHYMVRHRDEDLESLMGNHHDVPSQFEEIKTLGILDGIYETERDDKMENYYVMNLISKKDETTDSVESINYFPDDLINICRDSNIYKIFRENEDVSTSYTIPYSDIDKTTHEINLNNIDDSIPNDITEGIYRMYM